MLGNEQHPGAVPKSLSLEEIVAERIASEAARIAEDLIREAFAVTEFDPDEVYGFMNSEEAAEFLGLPYSSFHEIAPNLPRHAITPVSLASSELSGLEANASALECGSR